MHGCGSSSSASSAKGMKAERSKEAKGQRNTETEVEAIARHVPELGNKLVLNYSLRNAESSHPSQRVTVGQTRRLAQIWKHDLNRSDPN